MPRIEVEGFDPSQHGFTLNSGTMVLLFGDEKQTADNHNVYHSLQFDKGKYRLTFKSSGSASKKLTVRVRRWSDNAKDVLNTTVNVGEDASLDFDVENGWGQYRLTIKKESADDKITVSELKIISTDSGESAISLPSITGNALPIKYYSLSGTPLGKPERGMSICLMPDGTVKKIIQLGK